MFSMCSSFELRCIKCSIGYVKSAVNLLEKVLKMTSVILLNVQPYTYIWLQMLGNLSKFSSLYNWDAILPKYTLIKQEPEKCFAEINPGTFILAEHCNHKYMLMCLWLYLSERHK